MTPSHAERLAEHRIADIRTYKLRTRWPRLVGRNANLEEHGYGRELLAREVITDQGAAGWGICRHLPPDQTPQLHGRRVCDVFDVGAGVVAADAMPLEFALYDLAGVILDVPVYQMLGAAGGKTVPVYDAMIYMDDVTPAYESGGVDVVLDHCRQDYELGHRSFKIKIGRGRRWMPADQGLQRDIEVTRAIRERFADVLLLVDGNNGFTCEGFISYFQAVADCGLYAIEEPFHENRDELRRLREQIERLSPSTKVIEGEAKADVEFLLELGAEGLVDILNLDIEGHGFTRWRTLARRAIDLGLLLSPHTFDLKLKTHYAAHLLAGVGGVSPVEGVIDETEGVDTSGYQVRQGVLDIPSAPGFGMRLVWGRRYDEQGRDDSGYKLTM